MVIAILLGNLDNHIHLLLCRGHLFREDKLDVVILHLLEDTIGAEHKVVTRANVRGVVYVGTRPTTHIGLHCSCDDVTLLRGLCLLGRKLTDTHQVVDKRVVLGLEENLGRGCIGTWTNVIYPTIANMGDGTSLIVELEEGHCSTHLLLRAIILSI